MLYLIKSYTSGNPIYKLGFSKDELTLKNRLLAYKYHNPGVELIHTREGSKEKESLIHAMAKSRCLQYSELREWFIDSEFLRHCMNSSFENLVAQVIPRKGMSYADYVTYFRNNVQQDGKINWPYNYSNIENKTTIEKAFVLSKGNIYKNKRDAMKIITKKEGENDLFKRLKPSIKPFLLAGHELLLKTVISNVSSVLIANGIKKRVTTKLLSEFLDDNQTIELYQKGDGKRYIFIY